MEKLCDTKLISFRSADCEESSQFSSTNFSGVKFESGIRRSFDFAFRGCSINKTMVWEKYTNSGYESVIRAPRNGFGVWGMRSGRGNVQLASDHLGLGNNIGLIGDTSILKSTHIAEGSALVGIAFNESDIRRELDICLGIPARERIIFANTIHFEVGTGQALMAIAAAILRGFEDDGLLQRAPLAAISLEQALIRLMLEAIPNNYSERLSSNALGAHPTHLRRAIDFIDAHAAQPLSAGTIASAAGTSLRSLQSSFRQFKDTTISAYLRNTRLANVRRDLLNPIETASVKEIAYRWGFIQAGHFAQYYRDAFGELPSETRKKRH